METVHEPLDALNLISSSHIHEYYATQDAEDPLLLREKAKSFRNGYKNWRMKKAHGATGEVTQLGVQKTKIEGAPASLATRQASFAKLSGIAGSAHDLALLVKREAKVALSQQPNQAVDHTLHPVELALPEGEEMVMPEENIVAPPFPFSPTTSFRYSKVSDLGTSAHAMDVSGRGRTESVQSIDGEDLVDIAYITFDFEDGVPNPLDMSSHLDDLNRSGKGSSGASFTQTPVTPGTPTSSKPTGGKAANNSSWLKFMVNPYSSMSNMVGGPIKLRQSTLGQMKLLNNVPHYERQADHWICHIGVGGFHRSHQANYLHLLLEKAWKEQKVMGAEPSGPKWGLCGVGLMEWDRKMYETLKQQDYMFTLISRSTAGSDASVVGSIMDYVFAPDDRAAAVERLANPSTHIVSLTITEKGYCQNLQGNLDVENFLIKHDLEEPTLPYSAIGLITQSLKVRKERGIIPFTVLSCDNLPMNGSKTKKTVLEYCDLVYPEFKAWVEENVCFPNTMVDRITPITEPEHIEMCKEDYGVDDEWPVIAEDFAQWVLEDNFSGVRPSWEELEGVLVVTDVHSYEWMKLRLLNGTHSALSYPSYLSGYRFVDDSLNDALLSNFIVNYMEEVTQTVPDVPGVNLDEYKVALKNRFSNPYIKDKLLRLAEDGSQKLVTTMRDPMLEIAKKNRPITHLALATACFIKFMTTFDMEGNDIEGIKDPRLEELKNPCLKAVEAAGDPSITAVILEMVFGEDVAKCNICVESISQALKLLVEDGIEAVLKSINQPPPAPPSTV